MTSSNTNSQSIGLKDLLSRVTPYKLILLAIVTVINSFVSLTFALVTTWASELSATSLIQDVLWFCARGLLLYLVVYAGLFLTEVVTNSILKEVSLSLEADCMQHYLNNEDLSEDEIVSIVSQDVRMIREDFYIPTLTIPTYICRSLIPIIYLLTQNLIVGICFTIGATLMLIPQHFMASKLSSLGNEFSTKREASLSMVIDTSKGRSTIINHSAHHFFMALLRHKFAQTEQSEFSLHNMQALMFSLSGPLKGIADVVPFALGIYLMRTDPNLTILLLVAMLGTAGSLKNQFQQLIYLSGDIRGTTAVRRKVGRVLATRSNVSAQVLPTVHRFSYLSVRNLEKRYQQRILFENANFEIKAGQKVLIIGESGSGKSTLLELLMQAKQPDQGHIDLFEVNENGVRQPSEHSRQLISLISQRPHLFNLSIRDNICLGQTCSDDELLAILKQVRLDKQLGEHPLDFMIEQNGANISGGQQIKIEIARALRNRKQVIFADEITANLDATTSDQIRELLLGLPITIVEVAHHYPDFSRYDQVLEIDNQLINRR